MTKEELYKERDTIMERFDFEKVIEHMTHVDWKWHRGSEHMVPSLLNDMVFDLRGTARHCLNTVIENDEPSSNAGTGGFYAYKFPWGLQLVFSISTRSSF